MFTSLVSTLVLGTLLQDATAPAAAPTAAPTNDPKAESLLREGESLLYSPVDAGLESLSFDITLPAGPMGGTFGVLSIDWKVDGAANVAFEVDPAILEQMLAMAPADKRAEAETMMRAQFEAPMQDMGEQIAGIQTNRMLDTLLSSYTVKLAGTEEGLLKVVATSLPGADTIRPEQVLLLDEEGLIQRIHEKVQMQMGSVDRDQEMTWEPVEGTDKLVLASIASKSKMGEETMRFERQKIGDFLLVTRLVQSSMGQEQVLEIGNLVVNGTPVVAPAGEGDAEG